MATGDLGADEGVRRVREPAARILLVVTTIWLLVSAWQRAAGEQGRGLPSGLLLRRYGVELHPVEQGTAAQQFHA
jgi:hypothetical protein